MRVPLVAAARDERAQLQRALQGAASLGKPAGDDLDETAVVPCRAQGGPLVLVRIDQRSHRNVMQPSKARDQRVQTSLTAERRRARQVGRYEQQPEPAARTVRALQLARSLGAVGFLGARAII